MNYIDPSPFVRSVKQQPGNIGSISWQQIGNVRARTMKESDDRNESSDIVLNCCSTDCTTSQVKPSSHHDFFGKSSKDLT
jgi:hypothetical protein